MKKFLPTNLVRETLISFGGMEMNKELKFKKRLLNKGKDKTETFAEAASVFDVNNDGILDIVSGEYWYEGPDFIKKHKICDIPVESEYTADFCDYGMDVNGDGRKDIITGFWFTESLEWRENPGNNGLWKTHLIDKCGKIETIRFFDIDNCGVEEIFPILPWDPPCFYKLIKDENGKGTAKFEKYVIHNEITQHGMGFGDMNGDGKTEVILRNGWLEAPGGDPLKTPWIKHKEYDFPCWPSVPILAHDVTGNGRMDLILGWAHERGLVWYEQVTELYGDETRWKPHEIDAHGSQYHDMMLVDIDNDGELELLTGKRHRAHNGNDVGEDEPVGIYYFKINGGKFEKHIIDYGPSETASGVGIHFAVADLNGNGWLDIVAPGKEGLYLFENQGFE
jgi:hypothetical protein